MQDTPDVLALRISEKWSAPSRRVVIGATVCHGMNRGVTTTTPAPASGKRGRGRPSKGPRVGFGTSLPAEIWTEINDMAIRDNLPLGAIITRLVAERLGKSVPDYCHPRPEAGQQALLGPTRRASFRLAGQRRGDELLSSELPEDSRIVLHVWLPAEFRPEIESAATQDKISMGAIITRLVTECLGKPTPDYCLPRVAPNQEELPLNQAS